MANNIQKSSLIMISFNRDLLQYIHLPESLILKSQVNIGEAAE